MKLYQMIITNCRIFLTFLLLVGAGLGLWGFQALAQPAMVQAAPPAQEPSLTKGLLEKAQRNGTVRIIIEVGTPFQPEGDVSSPQDVQNQRRRIDTVQKTVLQKVSGTNARLVAKYKFIPFMALEVDAAALRVLETLPEVTDIAEDIAVPPTLASSIPVIGADQAWLAGYTGSGQTVAILDTGVAKTHPFFTTGGNKVVSEACYSTNTNNSFSVCPGGVPESIAPGSGIDCTAAAAGFPGAEDDCRHGTHVAGIAAGNDGGSDIGVARDADIIAIQVFSVFTDSNAARSYVSDQIKGLERVYELRNDFNIASTNMSLGGGQYFTPCDVAQSARKSAIDNLRSVNIATVISAGNDDFRDSMGAPACISTAVSVGATTDADDIASFSNVAPFLDLLAPGVLINASVPGGGTANFNGTSMAAPHVTGAWAVIKQRSPNATVDQVLTALRATGTSLNDNRSGGSVTDMRRINLGDAVSGGFTLQATPTSLDVCVPADAIYNVTAQGLLGFADPVTLAVTGPPPGATVSFSVNPVSLPGSSLLTIGNTGSAAPGSYALEIFGQAGGVSNSSFVDLNIFDSVPAGPALIAPPDGATAVSPRPTLEWTGVTQSDSYLVEVATDPGFTNIVYTATVADTVHSLPIGLSGATTYYWRVTAGNVCGNGTSATFPFTTADFACRAPNLAIPDFNPGGVRDEIFIESLEHLDDLDVLIDATHTFVGDLIFDLDHVDTGTNVRLIDRPSSCASNDIPGVRLDDEASLSIQTDCNLSDPAYEAGQSYRPANLLSTFDGEILEGTWRLTVTDNAGLDIGTLNAWCLIPTASPSPDPAVDLRKEPAVQSVLVGDDANFSLIVRSLGAPPLSNITLVDDLCDSLTFVDGDANNDNVLQFGESWQYTCMVNNVTQSFTNNASVSGTAPDNEVVSTNAQAEVNAITSRVLLVDDDNFTGDVRSFYTDTLDTLIGPGNYGVWDTQNSDNEPSLADLAPYNTVIWFSGDSFGGFAGPGTAGETALTAFLDSSGDQCLFISSQDYHFDRGLTSFMQTYLGAQSVLDDVGQSTVSGQGSLFGGLGPYSLVYPVDNFSDELTPTATAEVAFSGNFGGAAINQAGNGYLTTFFGFPFEALPTAQDRVEVLQTFLDQCSDTGPGPVAPILSIATNNTDIHLTWTDAPGNASYEVHRSPTPFFIPTESSRLATLPGGSTTYTDLGAAGSPATNYFYIVSALGGGTEVVEIVNSNEVGEIDYALNNDGGLYSMVTLPFSTTTVVDAASMANHIGNVSALLKWNPTTQTFRFFVPPSTGDNFELSPGEPLFIQINSGGSSVITMVGEVVAVQHDLTPGGFNFISLPLQRADLTNASGVAADITTVNAMLGWNEATQTFRFFAPPATGDNFPVQPGTPFVLDLGGGGPIIWP